MEQNFSRQRFTPGEASLQSHSTDISAVLQEIFQQVQAEMETRDRNLKSLCSSSVCADEAQLLRHDAIYRHEPLDDPVLSYIPSVLAKDYDVAASNPVKFDAYQANASKMAALIDEDSPHDAIYHHEPLDDPVLSYISSILAEDDDVAVSNPDEFGAYHAKASEMAALLNEDSPSLSFEGQTSLSPEDSGPFSESIDEAALSGSCSHQELDRPLSMKSFPAPVKNEVFLNSLRGSPYGKRFAAHTPQLPQIANLANDGSCFVPSGKFMDPLGTSYTLKSWQEKGPFNAQVFGHNCWNKFENSSGQLVDRTFNMQVGTQDERNRGCQSQRLSSMPEKMRCGLSRQKKRSSQLKRSGARTKSSKEPDRECVELNDLLLQWANAVGLNNMKRAIEMLKKVKQFASPYGNGAERLAHYFSEAMEARFSGTGWPLYKGLLGRRPSSSEILKATYLYMKSCPFVKAYHYFITQTILKVARGASKLHILELQIDGFQYPALFKALASRPEGPPQVHLIGLGFPHYSTLPAQADAVQEAVQKTGRRLSDYAVSCGVPFQFTGWAGPREDLQMQDFVRPNRQKGEVLVIISASLLRYVMDDTLDSPALRMKHMKQGSDLYPDVYIQGIITGSYSTPFFTRRFKEALFHFESVFDMLDTCTERERTERLIFESEILGKAILNIVACEGVEVMDRVDKYKNWQAVTEEVGFKQLPLDKMIQDNVKLMLETWHKEYTVTEDSQYLLMGWKGRMLHAMSTWNRVSE